MIILLIILWCFPGPSVLPAFAESKPNIIEYIFPDPRDPSINKVNSLKFSEFITSQERQECSDLIKKIKGMTGHRECQRAYVEYKIARQLSYGSHEQAMERLHANHSGYSLNYKYREDLERNDPTMPGGINKLVFDIVALKILRGEPQEKYPLMIGTFKRMYDY